MLVYKFKVSIDEDDNFLREIEIKPSQSFLEFHDVIQNCVALPEGEMASFYICDIKWRKQQEISLVGFDDGGEDDETGKNILVMNKTHLKDCINNPNEKLIYVYDFLKMHTFYLELFKIYQCDETITFPRCTKSIGDLPKTLKPGMIADNNSFDALQDTETDSEFADEPDPELLTDDEQLFDDFIEETDTNESY